MKKQTLEQRLIAGLIALGYQQDLQSRSTRYTVFLDPENDKNVTLAGREPCKLFVGHSGALRRGITVDRSYSIQGGSLYRDALAITKGGK